MKNNNYYYKKRFGQNFLKNQTVINKIVKSCNINKETMVIEIGPGLGALTDIIIPKCKKMICIEIDFQLAEILKNKYVKYNNVKIIQKDILKIDLKSLIKENFKAKKENIIVISNLPYYITSPILFRLFSINEYINFAVLMMQKEVGNRILAKPQSKEYNNLSIVSKYYSDIEKITNIHKTEFCPVPKVDSVVLKFTMNKKYNIQDEADFLIFIRQCFLNKRKTILNNISNIIQDKEITKVILDKSKITHNLRPENLKLEDYFNIWETIKNKKIILKLSNSK